MENALYIYNSLSRCKQPFKPLNAPHVGMYVCGPTVYGDAHLGHARPAITFDLVFRYLKHLGYKVRYVRNITDVGHLEHDADEGEDKIAKKARLENLEPMEVAQYYTNRYHAAMDKLNVLRPSIEPHASGHIIEQIAMVQKILDNGFAYVENGSVYFDIEKYNKEHPYGILSGRNFEEMLNTTRELSGQEEKHNPVDSPCGKKQSRSISCAGPRPGAMASLDGTWNARLWVANTLARPSTSTAAAWTSCSPTTSRKSPKAWQPTANSQWCIGCTTI